MAPYPFTTLNPHLGVVEFADTWAMTIADIPGIIAGAHEDRGLGHKFLRHVERTMVHLFIVDARWGAAAARACSRPLAAAFRPTAALVDSLTS